MPQLDDISVGSEFLEGGDVRVSKGAVGSPDELLQLVPADLLGRDE